MTVGTCHTAILTQITPEQIAQHAHDAGFRGEDLTTSVAVALAESGGDTEAHNDTPPDNSYGLWQVNMIGDSGENRRGQLGLDSNSGLFDPAANAAAAHDIYDSRGDSFKPWTTHENGEHEKHLDEARKAAEQVTGGGGGSAKPDPGGGSRNPEAGGGNGPGPGDGFDVDTDYFFDYAERAAEVSDELNTVSDRTVHEVSGIAADTFGDIGGETGFTDALTSFGKSLEKQIKATGSQSGKLGDAVAKAAKTYQESDEQAADEFRKIL
ncbi:type VII secretion target [Halosaccharopolyspora lacisalsi]|uniref:type VII secretion target n=1 Tax=Halosaccharopolyspora lacisalsi TaxID=1000566 RepID=UPI002E2E3FE9|nr:type VII secretion target [Halosaccharopolyspora lacisalsi]